MPGPAIKNDRIAQAVAMLANLPREALIKVLMSGAFREGSPIPTWLGSAGTIPEDERYLRQYMYPEQDILPRIGTEQGMAVRRMRLEPDAHFMLGEADGRTYSRELPGLMPGTDDLASRLLGLGNHSVTPLGSSARVEDVWDFKSPHVHPLIGRLMDRYLGTPFKVREEVPIR